MQVARKIKLLFGINKKTIKTKVNEVISYREYDIEDYKIMMNPTHVLDKYQKLYPLYDRFLPIICEKLEGLIIDVGANIGDTSILIFSKNSKSFIVGVEPDEEFSRDCMSNINLNKLSNRFQLIKKFVSTKSGKFIIEKNESESTGSISLNKNDNKILENNTVTFSELMELIPKSHKKSFDMLKIDIDGFDWDVLNSFSDYAKQNTFLPRFIFFEMQTFINNEGYKNENRAKISNDYLSAIQKIQKLGYVNFSIFDNFGTFIRTTKRIEEVMEISNYIKNSQINNNNSTIFHLDVLAFFDQDNDEVELSIKKLFLINKNT
jgi:FkbM family methyltransferase